MNHSVALTGDLISVVLQNWKTVMTREKCVTYAVVLSCFLAFKTFKLFHISNDRLKIVGFERLVMISLNDSRYEAVELRDGDKGIYLGNSVTRAVKNINEKISEALIGMDPTLQSQIDQAMIDLDKTEKKVIFPFIPVINVNQLSTLVLYTCL